MIQNVSRRNFVRGMLAAGSFVLAAEVSPVPAAAANVTSPAFRFNVFVAIDAAGTVSIIAHRSEMGSGSRTTLPRVVADELDADWERVKIVQAIGDSRYGAQDTDASQSIRMFFDTMRMLGASARLMLVRAAAHHWSVPESDCQTQLHCVVHRPTGRRLSYGSLAWNASKLAVPREQDVTLKPREAWRYIGKDASLFDLDDICRGKAVYGMDARIEGMLYASIERPPVVGGSIRRCDSQKASAVPGVLQAIQLKSAEAPYGFKPLGGVAVIATNPWAARQGRAALEIEWDHGINSTYNSLNYKSQLQATVRKPCKVVRDDGDVDAQFVEQARIVEAEYFVPHLAHASMEPPAALVHVQGDTAVAWLSTQNPQAAQEVIASAAGLKKENVTCHVTLLGGGFGRKSFLDFVAEAAILSKMVQKPIKLIWSREDDIRSDYYLPAAAVYMKAALDSANRLTAWLQRSAFPPINSTFNASSLHASWELNNTWIEAPFDVPNLRVENGPAQAHVRVGWLRSVASVFHTFAVGSFASELAHATGKDPLNCLLQLLGSPRTLDPKLQGYQPDPKFPFEIGRLRRVTELAAEQAGWSKAQREAGHGIGIAAHRYGYAYVAAAVQVIVDPAGRLRIPRIDMAVDCGTAVNPANIRAQLEGAAVFGVSIARYGMITVADGAVQESNFNTYRVARMSDAPLETHVHIVKSTAPPAGVGEAGVSVIPPALCNAIFMAIGRRIRELPIPADLNA